MRSILDRNLPSWLPAVLIAGSVLAAAVWYLWPAPLEFPMDDTYIHFVYAQNLVEHGKLMFNYPIESGVGSTSILWVGLLALGYWLGLPLHLTAKILSLAALVVLGWGISSLLRPWLRPGLSMVCALFTVLSGSMLWFALSGMETVLFLALGVAALLLYRQQRWGWLGAALGLQALTRPEGLALAAVIGLLEVGRHRRITMGLLAAASLTAAICAPWFIYLYTRTGYLLPTSAVGKQLTSSISLRYALSSLGSAQVLARAPSLLYLALWVTYLLEFVLGGISLPGPRFTVDTSIGSIPYSLSVWAIAGWLGVLLPVGWIGITKLKNQDTWQAWFQDGVRRPLLALLLWAVLHNLTYALVLPSPGTASRYGALNHILLWVALTAITYRFVEHRGYRLVCAGWLLVVAIANTIYWNGVYDANLVHMQSVRIRAAHYVRENLAADDFCAVSDIGAMRYYAGSPILDLGGLVDPELKTTYLQGRLAEHLVKNGVTCLILPGRIGALQDGWLDISGLMGISATPLFELEQIEVFAIERDEWLHGYLPVMNYQATVSIYRLVYP